MYYLNKTVLKLAIAVLSVICFNSNGFADSKFVAKVNGKGISWKEFNSKYPSFEAGMISMGRKITMKQYQKISRSLTPAQRLQIKQLLLEKLISHELLYQGSQKAGIKVPEKKKKEELNKIKQSYKSDEVFKKFLSTNNTSEKEILARIEKDVAVGLFMEQAFYLNATSSDKEVKQFYQKNIARFSKEKRVQISHIIIRVPKDASNKNRKDARKAMEKVLDRYEDGTDFADLAKVYSHGPNSKKGGEMGFFKKSDLAKNLSDAAFALKRGEISPIIESNAGFHLIKATNIEPEIIEPFDKIKNELVILQKKSKAENAMKNYLVETIAKSKIEKFLK